MVRGIGLSALCLCVAVSALLGMPDSSPKGLQHSKPFHASAVCADNQANSITNVTLPESNPASMSACSNKAEQQVVEMPQGMRAISVVVAKNQDVEDGCVLPGTTVQLLIQEGNDKVSGECRILVANAVYLAMPTCRGWGAESEEARRLIQETTNVAVAVIPEDAEKVILAQLKQEIRLIKK